MKIHKWEGGEWLGDPERMVVCKLLCGFVTGPTMAGKLRWVWEYERGKEHQGNIKAWRDAR